jgi:hypothetical protein
MVFIYMELVPGVTLEIRWDSLLKEEKIKVCEQLQVILTALRQLEKDPNDQFISEYSTLFAK